MLDSLHVHGNHDAPKFIECYERMGSDIIPTLVAEGQQPRVMLEFTGCLLHGLAQLGDRGQEVLGHLKTIACDDRYKDCVEFLGAPWGHPVAPSTPPADFKLHVQSWRKHFTTLFGLEALSRVRCFSPSEMALPNDPDVAFEFIKTLLESGYESLLVQEHTIEQVDTGAVGSTHAFVPHRLVCRNSSGEVASIVVIIKTQGSDTKLVGQMQPYYQAASMNSPYKLRTTSGKEIAIPNYVFQISDGENGGVMMNEFPGKYMEVVRSQSSSPGPALANLSEYLDHLWSLGISQEDLPTCQPRFQKRIWDLVDSGKGISVPTAIETLRSQDPHGFNLEGGSWTNDISWVKGYSEEVNKMLELSAAYWELQKKGLKPVKEGADVNALYHLLCSQTSCFRYWGRGAWTGGLRSLAQQGICRYRLFLTIAPHRERQRNLQTRSGDFEA